MAQALENVSTTKGYIGHGRGDNLYSEQPQETWGMSNFVDGSGPIFSMYLDMATEEDKKMVDGWKADADGILIFTGLFSAAVASLISVSIQDIRPNPQDTSNFYLANIYQTLANPGSNISGSLPASPPPFSPPKYAVWVNALLFLSLVISISCALLATLLQQWARRYLKVTQPRYSPHKRARIRTFFFEGVEKFFLPWAVEALPTLLHVSLFLFFAGISVFLWNVDLTIFKSVLSWIGICTALYGCITFVPIFRHDSPYHTPLSLPAWYIVSGISFVIFRVLQWFTISTVFCFPCVCFGPFSLRRFAEKACDRFESLEESYRKLLLQGMRKTVENAALDSPSEIDSRAFLWTFDSLDEDHELENFFSGLPGFRSSNVVDDPLPGLTWEQKEKFSTALTGLFDRTFSSDLLPESVKNWRAIICARALDPTLFSSEYYWVMNSIMSENKCRELQTSKFGRIVRGWGNGGNQGTALVTQAIVTNIVAGVQERDDSWYNLASSALGVPESVLRDYAKNGDCLSLVILIHVVRQQFNHFWEPSWPSSGFRDILRAVSKFDVQRTSPELQHKFCALWNQIVLKAQNDDDQTMASLLLRPIRNIYASLHQDTAFASTPFSTSTDKRDLVLRNPSLYPVCNVVGHIHDDSVPTARVRAFLDDNATSVPAPMASPDATSLSVLAPIRAVESLTDVPLLDNFRPAHQTTIESRRTPVTSYPTTSGAARDIITLGLTTLRSSPKPSISTPDPPLSPTSPPTAVALQDNEDLAHSGEPILSSPASYNPVLDNILPTESRRPIIITAVPRAPRGPAFAPDPGAAAEGVGIPKPGLRIGEGTLDPSVIHANTSDLPPQPSSPLSVTDSDVVAAALQWGNRI